MAIEVDAVVEEFRGFAYGHRELKRSRGGYVVVYAWQLLCMCSWYAIWSDNS